MSTTNITVRIDKELKSQADLLFSELGLNMSTAINVFIRQSIRQGKIPFELAVNPETLQAISDANTQTNLTGPFHSVSELMEDLNA